MDASRSEASAITVTVRPMTAADWPGVAAIHQDGIDTGDATIETAVPPRDRSDADHLREHRLVAELEPGFVRGWAALSAVPDRRVYRGVAEDSVHVASVARHRVVRTRARIGTLNGRWRDVLLLERRRHRRVQPQGGFIETCDCR